MNQMNQQAAGGERCRKESCRQHLQEAKVASRTMEASGLFLCARGALSVVYVGAQREEPVVLKVYRKSQILFAKRQLERLVAEVGVLRLACSSVGRPVELIGFRGCCHSRDHIYLFFDAHVVSGCSIHLGDLIRRQGRASRGSDSYHFPESTAAYVVSCVLRALSHLHGYRAAHRDVKPENVVIGAGGQPVLIDAGAAALLPAESGLMPAQPAESRWPLTDLCGTLGYMAPEVLARQGHGLPADVWSVGVLAFELLTWRRPFDGATDGETHSRILDATRPAPALPPCVLPAPSAGVRRLLEREPARRPTAADALGHEWLASTGTAIGSADTHRAWLAAAAAEAAAARACVGEEVGEEGTEDEWMRAEQAEALERAGAAWARAASGGSGEELGRTLDAHFGPMRGEDIVGPDGLPPPSAHLSAPIFEFRCMGCV